MSVQKPAPELNKKSLFPKGLHCSWKTIGKKYRNFTDLGRYVIDCDRHAHFDFEKARSYVNRHADSLRPMGCTAFATRTDCGDVLIGRNLDLTISQFPCYISHVKYGKYDTLNFTYDETGREGGRYDSLLIRGAIPQDYYNALPMLASDSMNSQGLYIEYNMRSYEEQFICLGTNPDHGIRVCSLSLPFLVASHCAAVPEALDYIRRELDIYTVLDDSYASGWNLCCMIGDAAGNYGLIEIANDEVRYLPRQHGQGNYYLYPEFNSTSREQSGYGRLQFGLERIDRIQSEAQMAALMDQVMWKHEILDIPCAYRDGSGHIHFCSDPEHLHPSLDWRSDNVRLLPINGHGEYVDLDARTPEARMVREYKRLYELYRSGIRTPETCAGYEKYQQYLLRHTLIWSQDNDHFEALRRGLIKHYTENGAFEKLSRYCAGDEKPLRDDAGIFTTGLSFTVNCTQKRLTVKFWENPDTVITCQW